MQSTSTKCVFIVYVILWYNSSKGIHLIVTALFTVVKKMSNNLYFFKR